VRGDIRSKSAGDARKSLREAPGGKKGKVRGANVKLTDSLRERKGTGGRLVSFHAEVAKAISINIANDQSGWAEIKAFPMNLDACRENPVEKRLEIGGGERPNEGQRV